MKLTLFRVNVKFAAVAPARERGLKCEVIHHTRNISSRSREGAWIEIEPGTLAYKIREVAPARERGLKSAAPDMHHRRQSVAPARERGLKSLRAFTAIHSLRVAPARERGLKFPQVS